MSSIFPMVRRRGSKPAKRSSRAVDAENRSRRYASGDFIFSGSRLLPGRLFGLRPAPRPAQKGRVRQ